MMFVLTLDGIIGIALAVLVVVILIAARVGDWLRKRKRDRS